MAVITNPATNFLALTPSDTLDPAHDLQIKKVRGLICNGAGNIVIQGKGDLASVTIALVANVIYPFAPQYLLATNTTATGITGLI